ncbi:MAG: tetratricopeptide repeat protein [Bacteroidales bacterium]|nr:tetratricopeptide repeat protein [Bacteroidales bacterium]
MSNNKQDQQAEKGFQEVELALTRTEMFIEKNQNTILITAAVILLLIAGVWAYNSLYREPLKKEAQASIFNAQYYFEADSFALALNGDGVNDGFLQVIDNYGSTPAGKLAKYYAGICYLNLGQFSEAKDMLNSFSSDDEALNTMAKGLIGDAESELGNAEAAISAYKKAANADNEIASPIFLKKLGDAYRAAGNKAEAKAAYQQIKDKYSRSNVARDVEKLIATVE